MSEEEPMAAYRKIITRLALLGLTIAGAALLNSKPVQAAITCQEECGIQYRNCLNNCHGSGTCAALCGNAEQLCLRNCNK
jgi:hypothetical protein